MRTVSFIEKIGFGRLVVACGLSLYAAMIGGLVGVAGMPHVPVLHALGVPALDVPFMDLHGVAAWCEADSRGVDPSKVQTRILRPDGNLQPNFLMNYPPMVLSLRYAGLTPERVVEFGILLGAIYVIAAMCLVGHCDLKDGILWALLLASPLSLLVVERANLDIVVFACFAIALMLRGSLLASGGSILLAGLLKLYPAAGLAALWMSGKRYARLAAAGFCGLMLLYIFTLLPRLSSISGSLQDQSKSSFGADVMVDILLAHGVLGGGVASLASTGMKVLALIFAILGIVGGFFLGKSGPGVSVSERSMVSFWLAAPMSIVLFILSNQMDYKWIFLLFIVPVVFELIKNSSRFVGLVARIWLVALGVYSYWSFFSGEESLRNALLKQAVMWGVFLASAVLTGVMLAARSFSSRSSQ